MENKQQRKWRTPEFLLVLAMLAVLTILVALVLWAPVPARGVEKVDAMDLLNYRKDILGIVLTAFGAWVGAGAAYFFGRENLREAAQSMLAMREPTSRQQLEQTAVREVPPRPIDWKVKTSDEMQTVVDKLKENPALWYVTITDDAGKLKTVVHEEAIWRFTDSKLAEGTAYDDVMQLNVSDFLDYIDANADLKKRVSDIYVAVTLDQSVASAYDILMEKDLYLGIISNEKGEPIQFITTGDVRRVLVPVA